MANVVEANAQESWFESLSQEITFDYAPSQYAERLFRLLEHRLLFVERPLSLQSVEGLDRLRDAIKQRYPRVAQRIEGLVDDVAASIQGTQGADLALAIRMGNIQELRDLEVLPEESEILQRVWRAILDRPYPWIVETFKDQLMAPEILAAVINQGQISLKRITEFMGPHADERLLELAPYLSFADFRGLDGTSQRDLLAACTAEQLSYLGLCSHDIRTLPSDMVVLKELDCRSCSQLEALPEGMLALESLDCSGCAQLQSVPLYLTGLKSLKCRFCVRLRDLPAVLPSCSYLDFSYCDLLQRRPTPQVPANAEVYREMIGDRFNQPGTWQVAYEEIPSKPKALLCKLGDWLLEGRPFPSVAYLEKDGQPFEGMDIGGVRRDLVARILTHLFQADLEEGRGLLLTEGLLPLWNDKDPDQATAYKTLARLMVLSFQNVCGLTTGPLFSKGFYEALLTEDGSLFRIAALQEIDSELIRLTTSLDPIEIDDLSTKAKEYVWSYLDPKMKKFIDGNWDEQLNAAAEYFKDHREELEKAILKDKVLLVQQNTVVECVRKELQEALGSKTWKEILKHGAVHLQKNIEGELSTQALWDRLDWSYDLSSEEEVEQTQKYFKVWLDKASEKDLRTFVRAVTGNRSLTPKHITVQLYQMEAKIPVAHSCSSSLDLSSQFPNQESFDDKMKLFLEHALKGSGFQLA